MADRLSLTQVLLLSTYAIAMAAGQVLFKMAALKAPAGGSVVDRLAALAQSGFFIGAIALYGLLAIAWVWILTFTPLSRAYLFVAIAFAITPAAGAMLFGEPMSLRLVLGIGLIFAGLLCVAA
jgi:drug/metabolite transporter (DMT)-like permease